jgi:uncharacterized protein (TIGR03382 family)
VKKLTFIATVLFSVSAAAHIEMETPTPRFNDGQNKWCPCGGGGDGSRNNDGCELGSSDDARGATTNSFQPGATIRVRWQETIGHAGRYRIAFDPDGADQADFNDNILLDIADPGGNDGNAGQGNVWLADVTLPDIECDNCTLQLVQIMNGDTINPVADVTGFSNYFQCANLVLTPSAPAEGEGEGEGEPAGCASMDVRSSATPWAALAALMLLGVLARRRRA